MRKADMVVEPYLALTLEDKMKFLAGRQGCNFSEAVINHAYSLRNGLAHASDYAATHGNAERTARLVKELRSWIERFDGKAGSEA